jgi:hypothetical protein
MASSLLFDRKVTVIVDSLQISDLRVSFRVKKSLRKEPNTCEVSITNLSPPERVGMKAKGAKIILQAGYAENVSQIFAGDSRRVDHQLVNGTDWVTTASCGDGERAYLFGKISKSYGANTRLQTVLADVVDALGIDPGNSRSVVLPENHINGYVAHGRAATELERLLAGRGYDWSIQDGRLQILRQGTTTSVVTVLSDEAGTLLSAEYGTPDKKGGPSYLKVKTLLQPQIRPGGKVRINSVAASGLFQASTVEHEGDTAGGAWWTTLDCLPVSG